MSRLVEIPHSEWSVLRDKFLNNWPQEFCGYYLVDNYIRWIEQQENIKHLHFYSLDGDWSDGTFCVVDRYQLFIYSLVENSSRLTDLLRQLDWSEGFKVSSFCKRFRECVLTVINERQLEKEYDSETVLYFLPRDKARNLTATPPPDFTLKPMVVDDAATADAVWPNRHQGSLFFLRRLISWNPNVGVYNSDGDLVAWCFRLQAGPLGALQVDEMYKRRGLGTLVAKAMAVKLAEMDQDTFALVNIANQPSRTMFEKVGFEVKDYCYWLRTLPNTWTKDEE